MPGGGPAAGLITHRLATVQYAYAYQDTDAGRRRIVEQGTHAELLARGRVYHNLHRLQFLLDDLGEPETQVAARTGANLLSPYA